MLTRLRVDGFKNLRNIDVRFGPLSCVAGPNAAGKSNLFDAIQFLSLLADKSLHEAAVCVRDSSGRAADIRNLFTRVGDSHVPRMSFKVEMIVPPKAIDDLGQEGEASITFLEYCLELEWTESSEGQQPGGKLTIRREELSHISLKDGARNLGFRHSPKWRRSALIGRRTTPLISTVQEGEDVIIKQHQDGGSSGKPLSRLAKALPRTILSVANATESPTVLCARKEFRNWKTLQLEPSALRSPDEFSASPHLDSNGSHLPATLNRLVSSEKQGGDPLQRLANRLRDLVNDVSGIRIDRDERRELLTLIVQTKDGIEHSARSLSDGTLRFIALGVLELDPKFEGVLCFEEPENGIHPERINSIIELLSDLAVDAMEELGPDNPLRQIIINTHSPSVVLQIQEDSLLFAKPIKSVISGQKTNLVKFYHLSKTWRCNFKNDAARQEISIGELFPYFRPFASAPERTRENKNLPKRVSDRSDLQLELGL